MHNIFMIIIILYKLYYDNDIDNIWWYDYAYDIVMHIILLCIWYYHA